jgi:hypothetical protein
MASKSSRRIAGLLVAILREAIRCDSRCNNGADSSLSFCSLWSMKRFGDMVVFRRLRSTDLPVNILGIHSFSTACAQLLSVTRGAVYVCMSSSEIHTLMKAFIAAGGHWSTFILWAKDKFTLSRSDYQRMSEIILYGWKEGNSHFWCGARNEGDVWSVPKPKHNRLHPTMKPVSLIERAIRNSSQRGDLVLDLFGGSGSSLIACEKTGRRSAMVELEPKYVDVIVQRWQNYTSQEAHLESTGQNFEATAHQRLNLAA